jgi:transposase InsO family protein
MQEATFDGADRPVDQSSGAQVSELLGAGQKSTVTTDYTKRGIVKSVQSSYGSLVDHVFHDADGLPNQVQYGDLAKTTTDFGHDDRRRLQSVQTTRGPPSDWTSPPVNYSPAPQYGQQQPTDFQLILEDAEFLYDNVDNPVELRDWRVVERFVTHYSNVRLHSAIGYLTPADFLADRADEIFSARDAKLVVARETRRAC